MRDNAQTPIIIFALNHGSAEQEQSLLRGLGYKVIECSGKYNGVQERSWLIEASAVGGADQRAEFHTLLEDYGQESYLFLDNQRSAFLWVYNPVTGDYDTQKHIGELHAVPKQLALQRNAWTETRGQYYVVR